MIPAEPDYKNVTILSVALLVGVIRNVYRPP